MLYSTCFVMTYAGEHELRVYCIFRIMRERL